MLPVIVIVGRSNVGKSTLFNRLTRSRKALVGDIYGLTRDRNFGECVSGGISYLLVDTGGFQLDSKDALQNHMSRQTQEAIIEGDLVIFVVDGKSGLTAGDFSIANYLRKSERPIHLVVNKLEGRKSDFKHTEFFELGLGEPLPVSAEHGDGVREMIKKILDSHKNSHNSGADLNVNNTHPTAEEIKLAIVGKPNVGKSTLFNYLVGEDRAITFDLPGTTRDPITTSFCWEKEKYLLVDTAGIRRRSTKVDLPEKFSVIKAMRAIREANVVILLLDGNEDVSDQDASIASFIATSGSALVVGINKWDRVDHEKKKETKQMIERKLNFLSWATFHYVSAIEGLGVSEIMRSVKKAYFASTKSLNTPKLTEVLNDCVEKHPPPKKGLFRPKLRYAHQGGRNPPVIIIHGNNLKKISIDYKKYLENTFREKFQLFGTPLKVEWKNSSNPYQKK